MKMRKKYVLLVSVLLPLVCFVATTYAQEQGQDFSNPAGTQAEEVITGKISLDIKGMDIIDVLKILAMRSNLNIVAGKNVRGKVTVFLKNVDVQDALEIILAANDLGFEKKGEIINVMTEREYEALYGEKSYNKKQVKITRLEYAKAVEVGKSLKQIKSKIGKVVVDEASNTVVLMDVPEKIKELEEAIQSMDLPTITQTFILNYAKAEDLEAKIEKSLTKNVGEVKIDERMNKIIVTDLAKKMEYIKKLIADFDERDKVVLIEAKIIQITLNEDISYGINWTNVFAGIDAIAAADLSVALPSDITAWPTTFTYTRAHGATEHGDQVILRLLERLGKTDVLSTPRITVANNQEAKVLVGTKEAYVTSTITQADGTTTTADNVEFVDVGVRLSVTPIITEDGYINLKIKPEVSSAGTPLELTNSDGSVRTSVPIITTAEAETQLLVRNGSTIIMAGLMKDTRTENTEKIPWLGDLPILGHFFTSRGKGDEKTEMVIFLTPHIVEDGDALQTAEAYLKDHDETGLKPKEESAPKQTLEEILLPEDYEYEQPPGYTYQQPEKYEYQPPQECEYQQPVACLDTEERMAAADPRAFQRYCNYIGNKINGYIQQNSPPEFTRQKVDLSFMLASNGALKERPKVLSPVSEDIKQLLIKSVEESSPFFPFPQDYQQKEEVFHLSISFEENP
jgi:type II secretory pathway component GspD/PulD (secretin)